MFLNAVETTEVRRLNIRLTPSTWKRLDALLAAAETAGQRLDLEGSVAHFIETGLRKADRAAAKKTKS